LEDVAMNGNIDPDAAMMAASVAGAAAGAALNRSSDPVVRKCLEGFAGALVGIFLGPAASDILGMTNNHARIAVAFSIGAAGIILLAKGMDWAKGLDLGGWLGRFGGPKPPPTTGG
jgi:hypothetical protein